MHLRILLGVAMIALATAAPVSASAETIAPAKIRYCHGFGCKMRSPVVFSSGDMVQLKRILAAGRKSPEAERAAISKADQWYERKAGAQTGTSNDGAKDVYTLFTPLSEIDCVDETENTTTLLQLIDARGWLVHHRAGRPANRGFLIDGRYPHNTATIVEIKSGRAWVVDSWVRANAEPPDIMPLSEWKKRGGRAD
ncbi:hypothetical protein OSH11_02725 [Kaistia dalseonensis]|uniref:Lipoprotein n=1 Tax=Kaistia dalseonensis TaxID=410840 RepID=A0ABU0H1I7_9HYPH|nr:hypothetical protein [Kaistia dalseonensis]MCX5493613.1 hypothetical protein [Kaistia dalseonensis]MDQ0436174.1 hypothetical protein [Kaistia dalseonensis]